MPFLRKYNTLLVTGTTSIRIPIIKRSVVDFALGADWTPAAGDVKVFVDGAAAANITNLPTAIASGNGAFWEFILTAAELSCKQLLVVVSDAATKAVEDQSFIVETYGNASAMYQADLSLPNLPANVTQLLGTAWLTPAVAGTPDVNAKQFGGAPVTATTSVTFSAASTVASTTNITAGTITTVTNLTNAPTAGDLTATMKTSVENAVLNADMTGHQTQGSLGQAIGDPVADTNTLYKAVVTDATGATVGVDVVDLKTQSVTAGVSVAVGGIATTSFAAGAIDAAAIAADAITSSELAQSAAQEIADEVLNRNLAGGGSGNTRNVRNALRAIRNKVSEAGGTLTITEEDDVTPAWTAAVTRTANDPISGVDPA